MRELEETPNGDSYWAQTGELNDCELCYLIR